jgi:hypothetical protein
MSSWDVFISYSHEDKNVVSRLAELMRIGGNSVFRDEEAIRPGQKWRLAIAESLKACKTAVIFWSRNAAKSEAVRDEYLAATERKVDVVPVLLDDTPLADELAEYQYVDLRSFVHTGGDARACFALILIPLCFSGVWGFVLSVVAMVAIVAVMALVERRTRQRNNAEIYRLLYDRIVHNRNRQRGR